MIKDLTKYAKPLNKQNCQEPKKKKHFSKCFFTFHNTFFFPHRHISLSPKLYNSKKISNQGATTSVTIMDLVIIYLHSNVPAIKGQYYECLNPLVTF